MTMSPNLTRVTELKLQEMHYVWTSKLEIEIDALDIYSRCDYMTVTR